MGFPFPQVPHGMQVSGVCQGDLHSHWAPSSLAGLQDKALNIQTFISHTLLEFKDLQNPNKIGSTITPKQGSSIFAALRIS